jgi:hypothetical protein
MPSGRSFHLAGDRYLRISAAGESGDVVTLLGTGLIGTADCEVSPEANLAGCRTNATVAVQ